MKAPDLVLLLFFAFNSWVYIQFDNNTAVAQAIQAALALLSIGCVAWLRLSHQSIPFILVILFTGVQLTLSFRHNTIKYFMLLPLLYNIGLKRVMKKFALIG